MKYENNLKKICEIKQVSLREISEKSQVSMNTLLSISCGRADINIMRVDILVKIATALKVGVKDLFVDKDFRKVL